jgi:hypothetical protein
MESTVESVEGRRIVSQKALADARGSLDEATAIMERRANRIIERLLRQGFVERADVTKLRESDKACRAAVAAVQAAEGGA